MKGGVSRDLEMARKNWYSNKRDPKYTIEAHSVKKKEVEIDLEIKTETVQREDITLKSGKPVKHDE